jgi:hypothetical protein
MEASPGKVSEIISQKQIQPGEVALTCNPSRDQKDHKAAQGKSLQNPITKKGQ